MARLSGMPDAEVIGVNVNTHYLPSATYSKGPLILVVEDDKDTQELATGSLAAEGLSCITAASVAEAISALQSHRIALVVLDWGLDRCGAEVLGAINERWPEVPVIVMSGRPYDVRTDAIVGHADAFLAKPFSATVLASQVLRLLKRSERCALAFLPEEAEDIRPLNEIKERYIQHAVRLLNHNVSLTAEKLGIHRQTVSAVLRGARSPEPAPASEPGQCETT
jgi:two-component system response regulator RegA